MPRNSTNYSIAGTLSFRLASRKILRRWGTNLANIEKSMRRLYVPDPGKVFVQVDQSGAEALVVAYLCRAGNYRELILQGIKHHHFVGLHVFKDVWKDYYNDMGISDIPDIELLCRLPIKELKLDRNFKQVKDLIQSSDDWPASRRYYYISKQLVHSSNYGVRANAYSMNTLEKSKGKIVITKAEAERHLATYHGLFPEIHEWHRDVEKQITETHYLYNLFGFPRYFSFAQTNPSDNLLKEAYAQVPQSTVACITHVQITDEYNFVEVTRRVNTVHQITKLSNKIQEALDTFGAHKRSIDILANTHDSSLSQCDVDTEHDCARIKQFFMNQNLLSPRGEAFKMQSSSQYGYNWSPRVEIKDKKGNIVEIKNPEGLREF